MDRDQPRLNRPTDGRPPGAFLRPCLGWVAVVGLNVLGILPWAHIKFPIADLGEMVYEVRRLQLGYIPYRDTFTHHFLGYVLPFYAVGSFVDLTPTVLKGMSLLFNLATAVFVWVLLRDVADRATAWLGVLLAVTAGWFWSWQGAAFNVQSYLAPVIAAQLLLLTRASIQRRSAWLHGASFVTGVLFVFDQRAGVFVLPVAAAWMFIQEWHRWRTVLAAVVSFSVAPLACAVLLWRAGAWNDFVEQTIVFPLFYRNQGVAISPAAFLSTWLGSWLGAERIMVPLFLAGLCVATLSERRLAITATLLAGSLSAALAVAIGGRPFRNYFLSFGPITIIVVSLLPWYLRRWSRDAAAAARIALASVALFCALRPAALFASTGSAILPANEGTLDAVARYLRVETSPRDGVLVWGFAPQIYVMSDRFTTFRDTGLLSIAGGNFDSINGEGRLPHMVSEFDRYLSTTPPKVIVVYTVTGESCGMTPVLHNLDYRRAPFLRGLRDTIDGAYRLDRVIEGGCDRAELFIRPGAAVAVPQTATNQIRSND